MNTNFLDIIGPFDDSDPLDPIFATVEWPIHFTFQLFTLAPRIQVSDTSGRILVHAQQKLFKFKKHIELFTDASRSTSLGQIRANRLVDWSARYNFIDVLDSDVGSVGRKGWRSMWTAHYDVFNPGDETPDFSIKEENPIAKILDSLVGAIPIVGFLTTLMFHPRYVASRNANQTSTFRLTKKPAFFEGKFELDKLGDATARETFNIILSFIILSLLERWRG